MQPVCLPLAASRALRVCVERGGMPYSAVAGPGPSAQRAAAFFDRGGHGTRVSPNSISTEPSAWRVKLRVIRTVRTGLAGVGWAHGFPYFFGCILSMAFRISSIAFDLLVAGLLALVGRVAAKFLSRVVTSSWLMVCVEMALLASST